MSVGKKILWGGLGWVLGGPIGAIVGYSLAGITGQSMNSYGSSYQRRQYPQTQPGDFIVCLLVLFGAVMKADNKMLKSELNFVKNFLSKQFSQNEVRNFMILFKDIIKQDYPLRDVCKQIVRSMDHPSRLESVSYTHLTAADDMQCVDLGGRRIIKNDFNSIKAMFVHDTLSDYNILEIDPNSTDDEVKKAYRKMAIKYHPDKVSHLGDELKNIAEEKFKSVNDAYQSIKKERKI